MNKRNKKNKKILLITATNIQRGGVQALILNWAEECQCMGYDFDWYCPGKIMDSDYLKEFERNNIRIICGRHNTDKKAYYFQMVSDLIIILKKTDYDIVHINTGNYLVQCLSVVVAKCMGHATIIAHSHNCRFIKNWLDFLLHGVCVKIIRNKADVIAGCTRKSIEWIAGENYREKSFIVPNKIKTSIYNFDENLRNEYRNRAHVEDDCTVICAVGNLILAKNYYFILDVIGRLSSNNFKMLIFGDGEEREGLTKYICNNNLGDKVILMGSSNEISRWLQAVDIFVMPSKYEGFGIAALEAQAAGLPCVLSNTIPEDIKVTEHVCFLDVGVIEHWISCLDGIISHGRLNYEQRIKDGNVVNASKYNSENSCSISIRNLYC